jgi:hypothetical protein
MLSRKSYACFVLTPQPHIQYFPIKWGWERIKNKLSLHEGWRKRKRNEWRRCYRIFLQLKVKWNERRPKNKQHKKRGKKIKVSHSMWLPINSNNGRRRKCDLFSLFKQPSFPFFKHFILLWFIFLIFLSSSNHLFSFHSHTCVWMNMNVCMCHFYVWTHTIRNFSF